MRTKKRKIGVFLIFIMGAMVVGAQEQPYRLQSDRMVGAGASFELWKAGSDRITEFALPVSLVYPYNDKIRFYALTSPAFSSLNTGVDYDLRGMSDLKWGGHCLFLNDHLLFTFGMSLPTGKSALSSDEHSVASVLSQPAFNFRVPSLGQGLDFQVGLNAAHNLGGFIIGGGVGFLKKGGFKPYTDVNDTYMPGDEITIMGGFEKILDLSGREMRITGDVLFTTYGDDTWGEESVFRSGDRIMVQLMSVIPIDPLDVTILVRNRSKAKNKTGSGPSFETERKNTNANQFEIQTMGMITSSDNVRWRGVLECKLYTDNDYGYGSATLLGLGGGGVFGLSRNVDFNIDIRCYFGNITSGSQDLEALGVRVFGGFQVTL